MFQQEENGSNARLEGATCSISKKTEAPDCCNAKKLVLDKISSGQITGVDYSDLQNNSDLHSVTMGKEFFFFGSKPSDESVYEEDLQEMIAKQVNVRVPLLEKNLLEFSCSLPTSYHTFCTENWNETSKAGQKIFAEQRITKALHHVLLLRAEKEKNFIDAFLRTRKFNIVHKYYEFERFAAQNPKMFIRIAPKLNEFQYEPKSNFIPALVQLKVVEPEIKKEYVIGIYLKDDNVQQAAEQIVELMDNCFKRTDEKSAKKIKIKISLAFCPLEIYENEEIYEGTSTRMKSTMEKIKLIKLV